MTGPGARPVAAQNPGPAWPGERLGLPESGPRSVGRVGRRLAALAIDWAIISLPSAVFFGYDATANIVIFAVVQILFIATVACSPGHYAVGLRIVPLASGWIGIWRPAVRTILLCLVIPALIWDRDQRGVHDRIAGTVLVRR